MPTEKGLQFVQEFTSPHEANKAHELVVGGRNDALSLIYFSSLAQDKRNDWYLSVGLPNTEVGSKVLLFRSPERTRARVDEWIKNLHTDMADDQLNGLMSVLLPEADFKALSEAPIKTVRILRGDKNSHDLTRPIAEENIFTHVITKSQADKTEEVNLDAFVDKSIFATHATPRVDESTTTDNQDIPPSRKNETSVDVPISPEDRAELMTIRDSIDWNEVRLFGKPEPKDVRLPGLVNPTPHTRTSIEWTLVTKDGLIASSQYEKEIRAMGPKDKLFYYMFHWRSQAGYSESSGYRNMPEGLSNLDILDTLALSYIEDGKNPDKMRIMLQIPVFSPSYDNRDINMAEIFLTLSKESHTNLLKLIRNDPKNAEGFLQIAFGDTIPGATGINSMFKRRTVHNLILADIAGVLPTIDARGQKLEYENFTATHAKGLKFNGISSGAIKKYSIPPIKYF